MSSPANQPDPWLYVVTDVEVDGPWPGPSSMRAFASVAVRADGSVAGEFEAVLEPLPGAAPDPDTHAWFQTHPEAWAAATTDPEPVPQVLVRWVTWVRALPRPRAFAASPIVFDAIWMDYYLRRYTRCGVVSGPYETDPLFDHGAVCIRSYAAAVTGRPVGDISPHTLPREWFGGVPHSHRAIDDARGYAALLAELLSRSGAVRP